MNGTDQMKTYTGTAQVTKEGQGPVLNMLNLKYLLDCLHGDVCQSTRCMVLKFMDYLCLEYRFWNAIILVAFKAMS